MVPCWEAESGVLDAAAQNMQGRSPQRRWRKATRLKPVSRRQVARHVWQDALEQADALGKPSSGKYASTPGASEYHLNDPSQKPKNCMASARPACSESVKRVRALSVLTAAGTTLRFVQRQTPGQIRSHVPHMPHMRLRGCFQKKPAPLSAV